MNDTLKAVGNIGAELGAAKAEVARLRGLLFGILSTPRGSSGRIIIEPDEEAGIRAALSQQAEPTDTFTAVDMATAAAQGFRDGQAAVEQAPAQDEREAFEAWRLEKFCGGTERLRKCSNAPEVYYYAAEQEAWKTWRQAWRASLAARPAQTEQQPVGHIAYGSQAGVVLYNHLPQLPDGAMLYTAPIAQTAPQPEQSEELAWEVLKAATDILDRRAAPHAWVSQAWAAGSKVITSRRAALSAQGGSHA